MKLTYRFVDPAEEKKKKTIFYLPTEAVPVVGFLILLGLERLFN